jgi:hypothetical protein
LIEQPGHLLRPFVLQIADEVLSRLECRRGEAFAEEVESGVAVAEVLLDRNAPFPGGDIIESWLTRLGEDDLDEGLSADLTKGIQPRPDEAGLKAFWL